MATPIQFKPQPVDPHVELMQRVEEAPREHAEALLVAWDLLQTAHDQGLLDLAQGLIGGRDIVAAKVAEGMAMPESIAALRNGIALARILSSIDPEMLHRLSQELTVAGVARDKSKHDHEAKPPSLWRIVRRLASEDGRRGLAYAVGMVTALGRARRPRGAE